MKKLFSANGKVPWLNQNFKKVKLIILLLITTMLGGYAANSFAQNTRLTLNAENIDIKTLLNEIEEQTELRFFYNENVDLDKLVSVDFQEKNVNQVLDEVLAGSSIGYKIIDKLVALYVNGQGNFSLLSSQDIVVKGKVTDAQNTPLPGVNVVVKGTTLGAVTDVDGIYTINVPSGNNALVFSYIGYLSEEIEINGQTTINLVMVENIQSLEEVVVIGYGTLEKKEITSSVTSIKNKDLIPGVSGNALIGMQGKVTGLSIQSDNGTSPNASTSVQLRGVASVLAGQGPLIVIDGIPGGNLNSVSREDIESIDILKDASAGAIYGTRAAGGVILITTKQARAGKIRLTYTTELTTETIRKRPEVLTAQEFVDNNLGEDNGHVTDWYDEVTVDNPFRQRHHVNLQGGSETSRIYATFVTSDQEGIAIGDRRKEVGGRVNANFSLLDGFAEIITHADYHSINSDKSHNGIFNMALKLNPTITPYDDSQVHGLNVWTGGWEYYNPVADIRLRDDNDGNKYFLGDATLKLNFTPHLSSQAMIATNLNQYRRIYYESAQHKNSLDNNRDGYGEQKFEKRYDKTFEWLVNYINDFGNHTIKAVGGYSFQEFNADGFDMNNANFPVDGIKTWDMGKGTYLSTGRAGMNSWKDPRERLIAFFARANYSYRDKYILTVSSRYEGSSKFYVDNQWGMFPAVSGGWRVSKEPFMDGLFFIDDLKLRAGYGVTGNQSFSPGVATRMYQSDTWWLVDGEWLYTYGSAHNQNKELQWEEKKELNIGADFTLLDGRISGKFDVYDRKVDQMIYDITVSVPPAIHDKTTKNVGSLRNKGWETELSFNPVRSKTWNYITTIRASHNESVLETLWGNQTYWDRVFFPAPGNPGSAVRLYPGQEIGQFYVWKFAGISEEGNWMLYDKEGNTFDVTEQTKTNEDKYFVGNAIPKIRLSWDNNISYKRWELNAFFTSWLGHDIFNTIDMYYGLPNVEGQNVLKEAFERNKDVTGEKELSDYWIEDGDFLKLKALTLRYNFNTEPLKYIKNANIYVTGRELFTITKYSGMDPESNVNGLEPGFEWHNNIYPRTRVWTLGVQLSF